MEEHNKAPPKRIAQHKLAQEVLKLVHGEELAREAEQEHRKIFNKSFAPDPQTDEDASIDHVNKASIDHVNTAIPSNSQNTAPTHSLILPKSLVYNQPIARVLYHAGLVPSRNEGQRMVFQKGAYLGARPGGTGTMGEQVDFSPVANWAAKETEKYIIGGNTLIIRVGKWKVKVIKIISDEEFKEKGLSAPGWREDKPEERISDDIKRMKPWYQKTYVEKAPVHQNPRWTGSVVDRSLWQG